MAVQFNNTAPTVIPGLAAGFAHQYDDVDGEHLIHAYKHLETGEMVFVDAQGAKYEALGDGVFNQIAPAPEPTEAEVDQPPKTRPAGAEVTPDLIEAWGSTEVEYLSFPLAGKTNGRIIRHAMRVLNKEQRQAHSAISIDDLNDFETELRQMEADNDASDKMGLEVIDDRDQLQRWLGVRSRLVTAGADPSPISESFSYMVQREAEKHAVDDVQVQDLVRAMRLSKEDVLAMLKRRQSRAIGSTMDRCKQAMQLINEVGESFETPEDFAEVYQSCFDSARKAALGRANSTADAIDTVALLNLMEDATT